MEFSRENQIGDPAYRALAAAILRTGFEAVAHPVVRREEGEHKENVERRVAEARVREWQFLQSPFAERIADALNMDIVTARKTAWHRGIRRVSPGMSRDVRTPPFRSYTEIAHLPPKDDD